MAIFHAEISNVTTVAKDTYVFLLQIYTLGQLECLKIDYNKFINIKMIYDNLKSVISDVCSSAISYH